MPDYSPHADAHSLRIYISVFFWHSSRLGEFEFDEFVFTYSFVIKVSRAFSQYKASNDSR
jgi:hypothetical protein